MKNVNVIIFLLFAGAAYGQTRAVKIESLSWLSGCWEQNDAAKKRFGSEQWMKPAGNMMMGMSRTVKNGKTVGFEFLRIVQDDTDIFYISKPSENKEETSFKLIKSSSGEVVFENPAHDFPQRIIYKMETKDAIKARIEGTNKGKIRGVDFPYKRVKCE